MCQAIQVKASAHLGDANQVTATRTCGELILVLDEETAGEGARPLLVSRVGIARQLHGPLGARARLNAFSGQGA